MKTLIILVISFLSISNDAFSQKDTRQPLDNSNITINQEELFDKNRQRKIPVAYISDGDNKENVPQKVVIISHGYGQNEGGDLLKYSYLTNFLARKGYFVVSIQHELPDDELLAMEGNFMETRMPNWKRGMENIHFVLHYLKEKHPNLDYNSVTLIGHSNGGDMSVLFAHKYPRLAHKIISLDNRRMPLPRTSEPRIFTIRSNDYPADDGVLPNKEEALKYQIAIQFVDVNHSSMDDDATESERKTLLGFIEQYLNK
ncbi:serine aminopeptidase domain-containing protein [Sphingobacterium corticis]|uniref:Serine aminopeptidase domain-containing protein n=1 Tax=Sphingobacterium corticis TaxID=1812823 RepID=A0ABW5NKN3_9SPHI